MTTHSTNPTTDAGNTACTNHFSDGTKIFPQRSCCDAGNIAGTPLTDARFEAGKKYELFRPITRVVDMTNHARDLERQLTQSREATAQVERERDGRETDLMIALKDLAAETAKNAELQGYVRKLAYFLGCKDDEDSPELGIKEMIADRAALREKLAKAEKVMTMVVGHLNWPPHRAAVASAIAAIRGNDKAEKGAL